MLALEEVGSSLTRVKKWGDGLVGGATMHTKALYLKTNSFTNSIMHFIGSNTKKRQRLLLAATLRRRAAASSHGRQPGQPGFLLSGERV